MADLLPIEFKNPTSIFALRWVTDLVVQMIAPWDGSKLVYAVYQGETLDKKPHGMGAFRIDERWTGFGHF